MPVCPDCEGRKQNPAFVDFARGSKQKSGLRMIDCHLCGGTGEISQEHARLLDRGRNMRLARIAAGLNMGVVAEGFGIPPMEMNSLEHGRSRVTSVGHYVSIARQMDALLAPERLLALRTHLAQFLTPEAIEMYVCALRKGQEPNG